MSPMSPDVAVARRRLICQWTLDSQHLLRIDPSKAKKEKGQARWLIHRLRLQCLFDQMAVIPPGNFSPGLQRLLLPSRPTCILAMPYAVATRTHVRLFRPPCGGAASCPHSSLLWQHLCPGPWAPMRPELRQRHSPSRLWARRTALLDRIGESSVRGAGRALVCAH